MSVYYAHDGRVRLQMSVELVGEDLSVTLTGGKAHIGAVALAVPRPSLKDVSQTGADASVLCVSGHKEDLIARSTALRLAKAIGKTVCCSAGIHFDSLTQDECIVVNMLADKLVDQMLAEYSKKLSWAQTDVQSNK